MGVLSDRAEGNTVESLNKIKFLFNIGEGRIAHSAPSAPFSYPSHSDKLCSVMFSGFSTAFIASMAAVQSV